GNAGRAGRGPGGSSKGRRCRRRRGRKVPVSWLREFLLERPRVAGWPCDRPPNGIGPGRVGTEGFRLLRSRSKIFRGLEDAPRIALADALRFLELALRAERAVRPARDESRDEGTCRLVPMSLLSGREADRGPFRELPADGTGGIVVLDLATTPARSGQDAIPQGQEAHLAVVDR